MKRHKVRRWIFYVMLVLTVLSSFLGIPSGKEFKEFVAVDVKAARIMAPRTVLHGDCTMPKNRILADMEEDIDAGIHENESGQYRIYRFLVMEFLMLLYFGHIYWVVIRQFRRDKITLWCNILYIHRSDGKKKMLFCNE